MVKICAICRRLFEAMPPNRKTCSPNCANEAIRQCDERRRVHRTGYHAAWKRVHRQNPEYRSRENAYNRERKKTPQERAKARAYAKSPKQRARRNSYRRAHRRAITEKARGYQRGYMKVYQARPTNIIRRRAYQNAYYRAERILPRSARTFFQLMNAAIAIKQTVTEGRA